MKKKDAIQRLIAYAELSVFCLIIPFIVLLVAFVLSRVNAFKLTDTVFLVVLPPISVLLLHLFFSLVFLKATARAKWITPLCIAAVSAAAYAILNALHAIEYLISHAPGALLAIYIFGSAVLWEIAYHILLKITSRNQQRNEALEQGL